MEKWETSSPKREGTGTPGYLILFAFLIVNALEPVVFWVPGQWTAKKAVEKNVSQAYTFHP